MIEEFDRPFLPIEVVLEIFGYNTSPSTYKSLLHICDRIHKELLHLKYRYCNQLWTLILKFPNWDWDWDEIAKNPNTTMKILEDYMENPSKYPKLTYTDRILWASEISCNPNLTLEFIEMYPDEFWQDNFDWDWYCISANPNMSLDIMDANPTLPWDIDGKIHNPNFNLVCIEQHLMENQKQGIHAVSTHAMWLAHCFKNPNITIEFIDKHIDTLRRNQYWRIITLNNNITVQHIVDRIHDERYEWVWDLLLEKKGVTLDFIEKYALKDGNNSFLYLKYVAMGVIKWRELIIDICNCECVTLEFVRKYASIIDEKYYTLCNPKVGLHTLEMYFGSEQIISTEDMDCVSNNPNLTVDFIEKYAHLNWNATILSYTFGSIIKCN